MSQNHGIAEVGKASSAVIAQKFQTHLDPLSPNVTSTSEFFQGWALHSFPVSVPHHPSSENIFPNLPPKPTLAQLGVISLCCIKDFPGAAFSCYTPQNELLFPKLSWGLKCTTGGEFCLWGIPIYFFCGK